MKKVLALLSAIVVAVALTGCGTKNTESNKKLAENIEQKSTSLVYTVETMDNTEIADLAETSTQTTANFDATKLVALIAQQPVPMRMRGINPKTNEQTASETSPATQVTTTTNTNPDTKLSYLKRRDKARIVNLKTKEFGTAQDYVTELTEKRSEVMRLCSQLRNDNITISDENRTKVEECLKLLDETTQYLESTKGTITSIEEGTTLSDIQKIQTREKIAIRQAKLQTSMMAMDMIIAVLSGEEINLYEDTTSETQSQQTSVPTKQNTTTTEQKSTTPIVQNSTTTPKTTSSSTNKSSSTPKPTTPIVQNSTTTPKITSPSTNKSSSTPKPSVQNNKLTENKTNTANNVTAQPQSSTTNNTNSATKKEITTQNQSYVVTPIVECPTCDTNKTTTSSQLSSKTTKTEPTNPISQSNKARLVSKTNAKTLRKRIPYAEKMPYYDIPTTTTNLN